MNSEKTSQLINWYINLNQENLDKIYDFYADDTYFKDPFHEYYNLKSLIELYQDMFKKIKDPKFIITKSFPSDTELVLFWDFNFIISGKKMSISGNTLFKFNNEDKINYHLDYWDSVNELWIKTPILGKLIRLFYKIIF